MKCAHRARLLVMKKAMRFNKNDSIQENAKYFVERHSGFSGHRRDLFAYCTQEELCEYLVTKYQNQFPLTDDRKYEFQQDHRLFAETIGRNVVKRKADFS
jgi:hypothetical protein